MKVSGAIFDMDGTILDSMYVWGEQLAMEYAVSNGLVLKDDFGEKVKYMFLADIAAFLEREYGFVRTTKQIVEGLYTLVEKEYRTAVRPKPGAIELLEDYQKRGVKMCLATATELPVAEMVLKRLDMYKYFSGIFTCSMVGARKQKPVIYEKALEFLGTPKAETPVFEYALYAIETAKAAGFTVVGIYEEFYLQDQEKIKALVDIYIKDLRDGVPL